MRALTLEQAREAGHDGYTQHLPHVPCPRIEDPKIYCASCQGGHVDDGDRSTSTPHPVWSVKS